MNVIKTSIPDLLILEPKLFGDERGYFLESYNKNVLDSLGLKFNFVQDNQSRSQYGVIRGLHYQLNPHAQTKLIRVLSGTIYDVCVDIRQGSPTFGKWFGIELSAENKKQLLVPKGFAHGFSILSDYAEVFYKCDDFYNPETESGVLYNDKTLNIDWKVDLDKAIVSKKDIANRPFNELKTNFIYKA